jgi:hypothetical protein
MRSMPSFHVERAASLATSMTSLRSSEVPPRRGVADFAHQRMAFYRHRRPPLRAVWRRASFQMSPHLVQRQYVLESGIFAVDTMDVDWQVGHEAGTVGLRFEGAGRPIRSPRESKEPINPPADALVRADGRIGRRAQESGTATSIRLYATWEPIPRLSVLRLCIGSSSALCPS